MLEISGNLHDIVSSTFTDSKTGEIKHNHQAEILHKMNGRSVITPVKLSQEILLEWAKAKGKDIRVEVRPYAMKSDDGGIMQGYSLADKRGLPMILTPRPQAPVQTQPSPVQRAA